MNKTIYIIILILLAIWANGLALAGKKDPCRELEFDYCIDKTGCISDNLNSLKSDHLINFFKTFSDKRCENNVEYLEWSNELLFNVIEKRPKLFFETLFSMSKNEIDAVIEDINDPLLTQDWAKLYKRINNSDLKKKHKIRALKLLKNSYKLDNDKQKVRIVEFD